MPSYEDKDLTGYIERLKQVAIQSVLQLTPNKYGSLVESVNTNKQIVKPCAGCKSARVYYSDINCARCNGTGYITTKLKCRICGDIPPNDAYYCIECGNRLR